MFKKINIYIFKETLSMFLLTIFTLTGIIVLSKTLDLIELSIENKLSFLFIFKFLSYVITPILPYTIPASILIAILVTFTRLSTDNEVTALKASGVSLYSLLPPVVMLSVIASVLTLWTTLYLAPASEVKLSRLIYNFVKERTFAGVQEKKFYDDFQNIVLYVDEKDDSGLLKGIFIEAGRGDDELVITAKEGHLFSNEKDLSLMLRLVDGEMHKKETNNYHKAEFKTHTLKLTVPRLANARYPQNSRNVSSKELYRLMKDEKESKKQTVRAKFALYSRVATGVSVMIFAIIALPLGIQRIRTSKVTGFSTALVLILLYYVITKLLKSAARGYILPPFISAFGANLIFLAIGIFLLTRAAKDRNFEINDYLGTMFFRIKNKITHIRAK